MAPPAPLSERRVRGHKLARGWGPPVDAAISQRPGVVSSRNQIANRRKAVHAMGPSDPTVSIARLLEFVMLASVVLALRASVVPISYVEKEVISRDRDLAQLFIGVGSPIVWTTFLLISIWLWS